ncbi:hypothetical protein LIER_27136 [Lithospermum erythrorhizon]|uniref:Uncharacterized protein n=1 Tax=Lithospermum erythrorhizon TaxID=34254 RepID=A0AAV3RCK0_LITER
MRTTRSMSNRCETGVDPPPRRITSKISPCDINLEFAQDIEDKHLKLLKTTCGSSVGWLVSLNLNGCQNISDSGIEDITSICPRLERFTIKYGHISSFFHLYKYECDPAFIQDLI